MDDDFNDLLEPEFPEQCLTKESRINKLWRRLKGIAKRNRVLLVRRMQGPDTVNTRKEYSPDGKHAQLMGHTRVPCSCARCGNKRRHYGRTKQEKIADEQ